MSIVPKLPWLLFMYYIDGSSPFKLAGYLERMIPQFKYGNETNKLLLILDVIRLCQVHT